MENDKQEKTLLDRLYEETEIKSNVMTNEEFEKIPFNNLYIANEKKKEELKIKEELKSKSN